MFKLILKTIIFSFILTFSVSSKNYEEIIVNGNERISNETILVFSEISDGKSLDENSVNEILKKLFNTGFFKDVSIKIENNQLIIDVTENPIIQTVLIEGVKAEKIKNAIFEVLNLKDRSSFNNSLLKKDETTKIQSSENTGIQNVNKSQIDKSKFHFSNFHKNNSYECTTFHKVRISKTIKTSESK